MRFVVRHAFPGMLFVMLFFQGRAQDTAATVPSGRRLELAGQAYLGGRYARVIDILQDVPVDSLPLDALVSLGGSYAALNDFENSLRCLRMAVDRAPGDISTRYQLARVSVSAGYPREGRRQYDVILATDSQYVPALFNSGLLAMDQRDYDVAASFFRRVVARTPRDYVALYQLASCLLVMDSTDQARQLLAASLTLNSRYSPALSQLASLYFRQADYRQALRLYRSATREYPDQSEYWYNQGLCYEKFDDYQAALASHLTAVALDSSNALYFAHLGQVYFDLRRFDSSAVAYEAAVRRDEENPVLLLNLGLAYARMGDPVRAEGAFRRSIAAHDPGGVARVYNQLGALYSLRERYRDARLAYADAIRYDPGNLEARFYLAVTLDRLGRFSSARDAYRKYLTLVKDDPTQKEKIKIARERVEKLR